MKIWIPLLLLLISGAAVWHLGSQPDRTAATDASSPAPGVGDVHGVENCPVCQPEVFAEMGFCGGHGVPEAICQRCRGDLEPLFRELEDWCGGHGLPESQCEACNPGVLDKWAGFEEPGFELPAVEAWGRVPGSSAHEPLSPSTDGEVRSLFPPRVEVVQDAIARLERAPSTTCATERSVVRLADESLVETMGLETFELRRVPLRTTVEAVAELAYDARRHARLGPRAGGVVTSVHVELGDTVAQGAPLVVLDVPALGAAKSEVRRAVARVGLWEANLEQAEGLLEERLTTSTAVLEARTQLAEARIALEAAEQALRAFGLDADELAAVRSSTAAGGDDASLHVVRAPFAGTVVVLDAVHGERADVGDELVELADTTQVWALLDVSAADIARVHVGQPVLLRMDGLVGHSFTGFVEWVSTRVDPDTRTVEVRAALENASGLLRAGSFGRGEVVVRDGEPTVMLPKEALQWEGCCNIALVQRSATEYQPRKLLLGADVGDAVAVLAGLEAGQRVVTQGSFLLKTELMRSSIGAGCCEVEGLGE